MDNQINFISMIDKQIIVNSEINYIQNDNFEDYDEEIDVL